jgi:hypothetical protein
MVFYNYEPSITTAVWCELGQGAVSSRAIYDMNVCLGSLCVSVVLCMDLRWADPPSRDTNKTRKSGRTGNAVVSSETQEENCAHSAHVPVKRIRLVRIVKNGKAIPVTGREGP